MAENVLEKNCWDYNQNIVVLKDRGWDLDPFRMCINELNDPLVPACTIYVVGIIFRSGRI